MRWLPRLAVLTLGVAAALTLASPASPAFSGGVDLQHVPRDFGTVMGYRPEVARLADGSERLVNPRGSCSVPGEGRPFDFEVACKAHDYGYDLLRYEEKMGRRVPSTAREQIDRQLTADLLTQCQGREELACKTTAGVFTAGVAFNTWRQVSGPPDYDAGMPRTAGLVLLGFAGVVLLGTRRLRAANQIA